MRICHQITIHNTVQVPQRIHFFSACQADCLQVTGSVWERCSEHSSAANMWKKHTQKTVRFSNVALFNSPTFMHSHICLILFSCSLHRYPKVRVFFCPFIQNPNHGGLNENFHCLRLQIIQASEGIWQHLLRCCLVWRIRKRRKRNITYMFEG